MITPTEKIKEFLYSKYLEYGIIEIEALSASIEKNSNSYTDAKKSQYSYKFVIQDEKLVLHKYYKDSLKGNPVSSLSGVFPDKFEQANMKSLLKIVNGEVSVSHKVVPASEGYALLKKLKADDKLDSSLSSCMVKDWINDFRIFDVLKYKMNLYYLGDVLIGRSLISQVDLPDMDMKGVTLIDRVYSNANNHYLVIQYLEDTLKAKGDPFIISRSGSTISNIPNLPNIPNMVRVIPNLVNTLRDEEIPILYIDTLDILVVDRDMITNKESSSTTIIMNIHDNDHSTIDDLLCHKCDICGSHTDEDELRYISSDDNLVCHSCIDKHFDIDYPSGEYYRIDDLTFCQSDCNYYLYPHHHEVYQCSFSYDYYHLDDLIELYDGDLVCINYTEVCELSNRYYLKRDLIEIDLTGLAKVMGITPDTNGNHHIKVDPSHTFEYEGIILLNKEGIDSYCEDNNNLSCDKEELFRKYYLDIIEKYNLIMTESKFNGIYQQLDLIKL